MRTRAIVLAAALAVPLLAACGTSASTHAAATASSAAASRASASAESSQSAAVAACESSGGMWVAGGCYASTPSPAVPSPATPTKVEFVVSGTAPDGIDITYGPAGSNYAGPSSLDGTVTESVPFDGSAEYYALNAQLQGAGSIRCKIVVTGPGDTPLTVSSGGASGGYNTCSAQAAPTDSSGLSWDNEN